MPASRLKAFWNRMSPAEREAFAKDGSVPKEYSGETEAMPAEITVREL